MDELKIDWEKWNRRNQITLWDRVRLFFVRKQYSWDHATEDAPGTVTTYKVLGGRTFVLAQELMRYGDPRNGQISRLS